MHTSHHHRYAQELLVFLEGALDLESGPRGVTREKEGERHIRRRLGGRARRLRQELENAAVFEGDDKREGSSQKLRNASAFGLKVSALKS